MVHRWQLLRKTHAWFHFQDTLWKHIHLWWHGNRKTVTLFQVPEWMSLLISPVSNINLEKVWFSENCQGFCVSLKPPPLSSLWVREMLFKQHHSERNYFWMSLDGYFFPQVRHVAGGELTLALPGFIKVFAYVYGRWCELLQYVKLAMIIVSKLAWGWVIRESSV